MNQYFSLLFISFMFLSCQKNDTNKFIGTWKGTHTQSGFAILKINSRNKTFTYISGGNGMKTFSNGNYKIVGDSIALTSTNATEIKGCYFIIPFGQCSFNNMRVTELNCKPSKTEFYEFLDNEIFYIKNHSLIYKPALNNNCPKESLTEFVKRKE